MSFLSDQNEQGHLCHMVTDDLMPCGRSQSVKI